MARKIVGLIKPFDMKQSFYVYEDGNKLDAAESYIDKINETIFSLMKKHDVYQVDLAGSKQYNKGLIEKIKKDELSKFGLNKLEMNIV